jgi:hypothetical protein
MRDSYCNRQIGTEKRIERIMKTRTKPLLLALAFLAVLSAPNLASAYYDPGIQRWINRDPLAEGGGLNLFTFACNSPANCYDTDGRGVRGTAIGAGIGGVIGGVQLGLAGAAGGTLILPVGGTIAGAGGLGFVGFVAGAALGGAIGNGIENLWCLLHRPHPAPPVQSSTSQAGQPAVPQYPSPPIPANPADPPAPGWQWRGNPPPGGAQGSWYNPNTGESLHPDLNHPPPVGPHWDWKDPGGGQWRIPPGGGTPVSK